MSDLVLPPSARPASKAREYPDVPCPAKSGPVSSPHGMGVAEISCKDSYPWFMGETNGRPNCAVAVIGRYVASLP